MSINKCIFIGFFGSDPEIRYMPNGTAVATFSIACNERWKDKTTGEQKETTEWIRCVSYAKQAEVIGQYFKKGQQIYIEGKMRTRAWNKDGVKQYSTEILVKEFDFIGNTADRQKPSQVSTAASPPSQVTDNHDGFDDDIPF